MIDNTNKRMLVKYGALPGLTAMSNESAPETNEFFQILFNPIREIEIEEDGQLKKVNTYEPIFEKFEQDYFDVMNVPLNMDRTKSINKTYNADIDEDAYDEFNHVKTILLDYQDKTGVDVSRTIDRLANDTQIKILKGVIKNAN